MQLLQLAREQVLTATNLLCLATPFDHPDTADVLERLDDIDHVLWHYYVWPAVWKGIFA